MIPQTNVSPYLSNNKRTPLKVSQNPRETSVSRKAKRQSKLMSQYISNLKEVYKPNPYKKLIDQFFPEKNSSKPELRPKILPELKNNDDRRIRVNSKEKHHQVRKERLFSEKFKTTPHTNLTRPVLETTSVKVRDKPLSRLSSLINASNGVSISMPKAKTCYKYFASKGNNGQLIKKMFHYRWWWEQTDQETLSNLLWTQKLVENYIETLPVTSSNLQNFDSDIGRVSKEFDLISQSNSFMVNSELTSYVPNSIKMPNKLENHFQISDKKHLFVNMKNYYRALGLNPFDYIPLTIHVENFKDCEIELSKASNSNLWIVKPGENSNRGNGIFVTDNIEQIKEYLEERSEHTYILQQYIENPLLIDKRKFDIRCFLLVTSINGVIQAYFYTDGYLRTASKEYSAEDLNDKFIHLTNDAVQKKSADYGKYENGNKLSFREFQKYLNSKRININFKSDIFPAIKSMVKDTVLATYMKLDIKRRTHSFEVFGYDFLIDSNFKPWLIEVNTNPCLDTSSPLLAKIIPAMLENSFRIAVDPLFPEPFNTNKKVPFIGSILPNKFELIFHEAIDGKEFYEKLSGKGTTELVYN